MESNTGMESLKQTGEAISEVAEKTTAAAGRTSQDLQQQGFTGVLLDLEILIRRYPLQAMLLGVGCGYLLSRTRHN